MMETERIFADTNLFLRYLTNDVPHQAEAFERMLGEAVSGEIVFIVNSLVIAEIVWTLESYYELPREDIQNKILAILNTPGVDVEYGDIVLQAIFWYVDKRVDYIDAFNAAWMLSQDIQACCTYDRRHFSRLEGISILVPGEMRH